MTNIVEISTSNKEYHEAMQRFLDQLTTNPMELTETMFCQLLESENSHLLNKHDRCIMFFVIPEVYHYSIILSAFTGWSRKMLALSLNCTGCSVVRNLIVLPCVIRDCIS